MTDRLTSLSRSIEGRVAIVTGAASGMGRATAHLFADEGAHVVVADLGSERVAAVVGEIHAVHGDRAALGVVCDVADVAQLEALVARTLEAFGRLDIVVNNAGVALPTSLFEEDDEAFESNWASTLDINLTAHARLVRLALPALLKSDAARVVNIASTEAIVTSAGMTAYAATKAGVVGLTKSMAVEVGRQGVTVNCICPGAVETGMTEDIPPDAKQTYARRRVPVRRYAQPEEIAHMTLNLCLPASSYVNGAIIPVDGGMTIRHT
ncbi:MAG: SDR family NAD(P)-dependent oxidoreductase [Ilumatobacter sp.]|uniref:SDR family NAD(P)-dependent oxidoreductase n=1 Tax=Ilumatobacter sp. TaxID=1967498 RepID=UPI0026045F9D|nr:SDR family NAD(P)-dependent oxidoreductase [Ilumatobacter sp.]MDJ0771505.1 SDR family NAD(P)-dependent oxidoreductase [Ilumatobacter sp.]